MTPALAVSADSVSAGPLGLLVVVLMMIATALLIRNMNGRLRRLPPEFPPREVPRHGEEHGPQDDPRT